MLIMGDKLISDKISSQLLKIAKGKKRAGGYKYTIQADIIKLYVWTPKKEYNIDITL